MLVSVVIPAYNEEKYLAATLQSVKNQTHFDFDYEVIVADAQSTDQTAQIAKNFGAKVINVPKLNPAIARQKAVEQTQGEIIFCLDADTTLPKDHLQKIIEIFKKEPKTVAITGLISGQSPSFLANFLYLFATSLFTYGSFLLGKPVLQGQSFAFRKKAFDTVGGFNCQLGFAEDLELAQRLSKVGKVKLLPRILGFSSVRRLQEGSFVPMKRTVFAYLLIAWNIKLSKSYQLPSSFPNIR